MSDAPTSDVVGILQDGEDLIVELRIRGKADSGASIAQLPPSVTGVIRTICDSHDRSYPASQRTRS